MRQYLDLLQYVLDNGEQKGDRTGTGTISIFGHQLRFNLAKGFPLLTTKKMYSEKGGSLKSIIHELLWFLKGETNIKYLKENGVSIWDEWADENGELGPVYGKQWRNWDNGYIGRVDQIKEVIEQIKCDPNSRRHLINAWNVTDVPYVKLPPCHYAFQFYVVNNKLSCIFNMRSTDTFLGLPFNIASYALLTMMVAQVCGLELGELIFSGADVHIYNNHLEQIKLQLTREPFPLPIMILNPSIMDIDDFKYSDFQLLDYQSHGVIKGDVSV